jgi:DNA polymerase-3 subunit alpha
MAERTGRIGASACALTDHGSVSGAVDFFGKMKEKGLRPILGSEMYVCKGLVTEKNKENRALDHQVILAKNEMGWKDLLRLTSLANKKEHSYYRPRIDIDLLAKAGSQKNLISFSGHLGSILSNAITDGERLDPDWMKKGIHTARMLENIFGKGNFFIEIQLIDSKINKFAAVVGGALRQIAVKTGIPCVATPDAHYCSREDAEDQQVLLCTSFKKTIGQVQRELKQGGANRTLETFFRSNNYHIPSYEDMIEFHTEEELANTRVIADMCQDYNILHAPNPPLFNCPKGMAPDEYLRYLCRTGWAEKMPHIDKDSDQFLKYGERVNHELDVFTGIGLSSYFLIVDDILRFTRSRGYLTGPGRGSAAGCIVSYLLNITQIDPIPYNLIFERFYNAGRNAPGKISWPDIDFDVPKAARGEIVEYVRKKYGEDNVAQIVTFQTLKGRASLKRVMSARGNISFDEQNAITKHIVDESKIADELGDIKKEYGISSIILWALENNSGKLKDWCQIGENGKLEGRMARIFEQAIRLENTKIISGKHAAGIVISANPISDSCPMVLDKQGENMLAGFEGPSCEDVGLLKLDCLGISTLDKLMDATKIIAGEDDAD